MGTASKSFVLILIALFLTSLAMVQPATVNAQSKTITVPDDYLTIQEAIDNASAGDTVFVRSGTYTYIAGSASDGLLINKSISLIGEDNRTTILKPIYYSHYGSKSGIHILADSVTVSGFTISGQANSSDPTMPMTWWVPDRPINIQQYGVLIGSGMYGSIDSICPSDCKITGNIIANNSWKGIAMGYSRSGTGNRNVVSNNLITQNGDGISYLDDSGKKAGANNSIINNSITQNNGCGISIDSQKNMTIKENYIAYNGDNSTDRRITSTGGLFLSNAEYFDVSGNNITNNFGFGVRFDENCNYTSVYNNNIFRNNQGIHLSNFGFYSNNITNRGGNKLYYNNIADNSVNAFVEQAYPYNVSRFVGNGTDLFFWDNGKVGNYWSDYNGQGNYTIDENNVDHHPLTQQIDIYSTAPTPTPNQLNVVLILPIAIVVIVLTVTSVLLYRIHRKTQVIEPDGQERR